MVIYTPSVALETATGLDRWTAVWLTGGVCIFYTSIGGLKAVVWTDTFQVTRLLEHCIFYSCYLDINHAGRVYRYYC